MKTAIIIITSLIAILFIISRLILAAIKSNKTEILFAKFNRATPKSVSLGCITGINWVLVATDIILFLIYLL